MKKLFASAFILTLTLALVLTPLPRAKAADQAIAHSLIRFDVDSTTPRACREEGIGGNVTSPASQGGGRIKTTGSSTSVASETAASGALTPVAVGDVIIVTRANTPVRDVRIITVKTDNDTVTIDSAVDWSAGFSYAFYKTVCGTTDADGWIDTSGAKRISISIRYEQGDLDNLSWRFECRQSEIDPKPTIVYPSEGDGCGNGGTQSTNFCDFPTPGVTGRFTWEEFGTWSSCRIFFKVKTTDTSDAGANLEQVYASIVTSTTP